MGCCVSDVNRKEKNPEILKLKEQNNSCSGGSLSDIETSKEFNEYKREMTLVFYTFAGIDQYSKKRQLYMKQNDLQKFLDIVCITTPVNEMFRAIDTAVIDNTISYNEWMEYFCDNKVNPNCYDIYKHITSTTSWTLLKKSLKLFEILDTNHNGRINWGAFESKFAKLIGLNPEETEQLWETLDTNNSGDISITELFEWFHLRLHSQIGRQRNSNVNITYSDLTKIGNGNGVDILKQIETKNSGQFNES